MGGEHNKAAPAYSLSQRNNFVNKPLNSNAPCSPGPAYILKPSIGEQPVNKQRSSPRYGFGTSGRFVQPESPFASPQPGPGAYSPRRRADGSVGGLNRDSHTQNGSIGPASRTKLKKVRDRSICNVSYSPGPAYYSPRASAGGWDAQALHAPGPAYSMTRAHGRERILHSNAREGLSTSDESPAPTKYSARACSSKGGGYLGDAPAYTLGERACPRRFISDKHAYRINQGIHSPGPQVYTPREELGVTNYTVSNTSTHAPNYSFGTEARPAVEPTPQQAAPVQQQRMAPRPPLVENDSQRAARPLLPEGSQTAPSAELEH